MRVVSSAAPPLPQLTNPSLKEAQLKVVLATRNPGKVIEFRRLLSETNWSLLTLDDVSFFNEINETGNSYRENAVLKAEMVATTTGHAALSDDSGIEILALDNWPGITSARWLGEDANDQRRCQALWERVTRDASADRQARYISVVALAVPGRANYFGQGMCSGFIVDAKGNSGFGYDPIFFSPELQKTFGAATAVEKDRVSHRARAFTNLLAQDFVQ